MSYYSFIYFEVNSALFYYIPYYFAGYLDSVTNDACLVLLVSGGAKAEEWSETLGRASFTADVVVL